VDVTLEGDVADWDTPKPVQNKLKRVAECLFTMVSDS